MNLKKKRICFLIPSHHSGAMGGSEYQAMLILNYICHNNEYDVVYLCRRSAEGFIPQGYRIKKINSIKFLRRFGSVFDIFCIIKALIEIKPDSIYQRVGCAYTGIAAFYTKLTGAKLIWHISSDDNIEPKIKDIKHKLMNVMDRCFLNYGIRNANIIICQTKYQKKLLYNNFKRKCNAIIPVAHPLPLNEVKRTQNIIVLWIGNLKPLKQPEIFVQLSNDIYNKNINVSFIMLGRPDGPKNWIKLLMAQIRKAPNLHYLGEVSQKEVNDYLSAGHILVNTSQYEGFSNTFVQAWMRKVPVVSLTADPDNILVNKKIGLLSETYKRLCSDVKDLIENQELRLKMGQRAWNYSVKNHQVDGMVQKIKKFF